MQLNKWLAGLAPCIILLFILSLSVVDVEGKKGRKRPKGGNKHGPRRGGGPFVGRAPPSGGVEIGDPGQEQHGAKLATRRAPIDAPNGQACPNTPPFGDVKGNISELWKEVQHLSNPIHIHVHGGHAWGGPHHSPRFMGRRSPHGRHSRHSRGRKGHHPFSPGGKGRRHGSHGPGGKGHHKHSPGGKGRRHPGSPAGKGKPTPGGKRPGRSVHSGCSHNGYQPSHETHIHVHVTLDTEKNKFEEFMAKHFDDYEYARCDLIAPEKDSPVTGTVLMRQMFREPIEVKVNISGMAAYRPAGVAADHKCPHGFHVHEFADFSQGCTSFGPHYNPKNTSHGPENADESHAGDWGNIECDKDGNCVASMNITNSVLLGPFSIIGRGIVLHQLQDDLGEVGDEGSLTTGNAGKRIACCGVVRTGPPSDGDW